MFSFVLLCSLFFQRSFCFGITTFKILTKLRYYKEVINPNLEDQKYLSVVTSSRNKINIAKIRTNSHELHNETWRWYIPKTPWAERVFHLCGSMSIEDENHLLLECLAYTHIRYAWKAYWQAFWAHEQDFKVNQVLASLLASFLSTWAK